ncbi:MAG TPA: 50S ribosomal protein L11 methyltransferase [Beijerinckiaceae bacterium]|nr:50S ribosomal protein L11 methyltransferase [Beijerinckiaceae bacterium]
MREGLLPNNATHLLRLAAEETLARRAADLLTEILPAEETAAAAFEVDDGRSWSLEVYFASPPDQSLIRELLAGIVGADLAETAEFAEITAKDWVSASLEGLAPVAAGRFLIHGGHDRHRVRTNQCGIEIEAALAFGTGHHGTTRGCLLHLEDVLRQRRPHRVLDVGTGTGVLAIAAARALKQPVSAGDIDPVSTITARANALANRAGAWLRPITAPGVRHPELVREAPYDLIFANILARPLMRLAPTIASVASGRATLILSGLLPRDVNGILAAYRAQGFRLVARKDLEGWVSLRLVCGSR